MKAITLIQPWASLIAFGEKKIETRSWNTNYKGPLLIHAGKKVEHDLCQQQPFKDVLLKHGIVFKDQMPTGVIIAKCELVDCAQIQFLNKNSAYIDTDIKDRRIVEKNELAFGDYTPGRFAWILDNVEIINEPIPAKGKLGLWEFKF